jgi:hypothetical protein
MPEEEIRKMEKTLKNTQNILMKKMSLLKPLIHERLLNIQSSLLCGKIDSLHRYLLSLA